MWSGFTQFEIAHHYSKLFMEESKSSFTKKKKDYTINWFFKSSFNKALFNHMIISFTKKDFRVDFVTVDVVVVKWRKKECFQCWPFFQLDYYITFTKNVLKIVSIIQWNFLTDSWISFRVGLTRGCEMILHSFVDVGGPFGTFFSGLNIRGCGSLFKLIQKTFCICGFQNCKKREKVHDFQFLTLFFRENTTKSEFRDAVCDSTKFSRFISWIC